MTRLEAVAIIAAFVVVGIGLLAWGLITIWHRRRRPEPRQEPVSMADLATTQNELNRLAEKQRRIREEVLEPAERQAGKLWGQFGIHTDQRVAPGTVAVVTGDPREVVVLTNAGDPDDWLGADPPAWDFPPKVPLPPPPPSIARPWSHG